MISLTSATPKHKSLLTISSISQNTILISNTNPNTTTKSRLSINNSITNPTIICRIPHSIKFKRKRNGINQSSIILKNIHLTRTTRVRAISSRRTRIKYSATPITIRGNRIRSTKPLMARSSITRIPMSQRTTHTSLTRTINKNILHPLTISIINKQTRTSKIHASRNRRHTSKL